MTRSMTAIRSNSGISTDQLRSVAPSVFAEAAAEKMSSRYTYIPTSAVLDGMQKEGWQIVSAAQSRARSEDRRQHARHQIRMRHASTMERALAVGDSIPEIVLTNSHDGSSSYQLTAGVFRLVCSNGLVAGGESVEEMRVRHSGDVVAEVIGGATRILDQFGRIMDLTREMQGVKLTRPEALALAAASIPLRFDEEEAAEAKAEGKIIIPEPDQLLTIHRRSDDANDLWSTFNVIQENVIRGGIRPRNGRQYGDRRTREVTSVDKNTAINKGLWILAEQMKKIKQGV